MEERAQTNPSTTTRDREQELRHRLGIPPDAQHILIFAESSHWDPDWLLTAEEYLERYVCKNLDQAIGELLKEPRRVYSVESVFFLREYWERRPKQHDTIRTLINQGRMRLTSSGVSTADTILPVPEAILRDFLLGQEWLRENGLTQEPRLAYFPDSFGYSPGLPALLNAAGFDQAGISRIDGMFFPGCEFAFRPYFPPKGSSAWILLRENHSLDFYWRDRSGSQVLCHWNAYTYGQGDMLAFSGLSRVYLFPVAVPNRAEWNVTRHIHQYFRQLRPFSQTPYMFCPIGFDFVPPIPNLVALLDRYNRHYYPETGLWTVNAGLDDYLELVECHRERLPVLYLDPNPYWTGFYTSRPCLKQRCHELVDALLLAEQLAFQPGNEGAEKSIGQELAEAWWTAAVSNHHDFITGTATDRVVTAEQMPIVEHSAEIATEVISRLEKVVPVVTVLESERAELPEWRRSDGVILVHTPHYKLEIDERAGGCIVRAWEPVSNQPLLSSPSNDLILYRDAGGLWRMGNEFIGGTFKEVDRASSHRTSVEVRELKDSLEVICAVELGKETFTRRIWLRADNAAIRLQVHGHAPSGYTVTLAFETGITAQHIAINQPVGVFSRPVYKRYAPTFWPVQSFLHLVQDGEGPGVAFFLNISGAAAYRPGGRVEIVTHRNASQEKAFHLIPFPGMPVSGHERSPHAADFGLCFTTEGDWLANELPLLSRRVMALTTAEATLRGRFAELASSWIALDEPGVYVIAVKPASRGQGLILRLLALEEQGLPVTVSLPGRTITAAYLCDVRERDLRELEVRPEGILVSMPGAVATVRVIGEW